jgi:hypothetical protein
MNRKVNEYTSSAEQALVSSSDQRQNTFYQKIIIAWPYGNLLEWASQYLFLGAAGQLATIFTT